MAKSDNGELNNSNLASNNNDPNNSLLKKVTKRVSGLFPSSITKWFGPSDGSHSSVIRRRELDDDDEQLQIQQPPKKRAKQNNADVEFSTSSNYQMTSSTPLLNSNSRHLQPGSSGFTRPLISTTYYDMDASTSARSDTACTSTRTRPETLLNGDDKSDSGESTSGYSSVLAQQQKKSSAFVAERGHVVISQPSTSKESETPSPNKSLDTSLNSSRSLFSDRSLNPQRQCLNSRRPSFNSSTFGSPTFMDRTLSTKRAVNSPFYGGRTIYGGASAYKRNRIIFPRDEANNLQAKNSITIKPVNDSSICNENVSLSKTARRILDTLEHFSTPVLDAKKIPNINRQNMNKTQRITPYARDAAAVKPTSTAPNRELIIPSVPDLLKMKQKERLQNSTEQVRKVATTSNSILNSAYSIRTLEEESTKPQKLTNKIKAKIATVRDKKDKLLDVVDAVQLPEVKLPITNLPKFDFIIPPPPASVTKQPKQIEMQESPSTIITGNFSNVPANLTQYKFAKPILVVCTSDTSAIHSTNNHFKFSEPIDAKNDTKSSKERTSYSVPSVMKFKTLETSTAPRKKEFKNNGQQKDVGFSVQPQEQLVQGSVMDILGKQDSLMDKFKPAVDTWECSACMVRNIPTAVRCVACETPKEPVNKKLEQSNSFGNKFKMSAEKWECGACMVRNDILSSKCVACTTPKPNSNAVTPQVPKPVASSGFGGFEDKFKPASNTWECGACMIRNKSDTGKCVACESPKPGAEKERAKSSLLMPDAVATAPSGFLDLIKKQQSHWECPSCMVRNSPEKKTCACCEGPKPGEKQEFNFGTATSQFKFGIDKTTAAAAAAATNNTSGFKFGVNETLPATFSFGVQPITTDPVVVQSKQTGFTFGVQPTPNKESSSVSAPTLNTTKTVTAVQPSFTFGPTSTVSNNIVLNGDPKKLFSFGTSTQSTTITSSTNSNVKPTNPTTTILTTTVATSTVSTSTVSTSESSTVSSSSTPSITSAASTTFSFGVTPKQPTFAAGGADKNPDVVPTTPQFNFGSGSLTFNSLNAFAYPTASANSDPNIVFKTSAPPFKFKPVTPKNNNKTEVKPFSFTKEPSNEKIDVSEFIFNPSKYPAAPPPSLNTIQPQSQSQQPKASNNMFSFGAKTTETKQAPNFGGSNMFGQQTPQNGGFNFGATAVTPNFNFGAGAAASSSIPNPNPVPTSTIFGFGSSQAGSGSAVAAAPAASAPGVFTFGGGTPAQQPTTAAFTPDNKPTFNFTGGTPVSSFTAQGGPSATMPQRKIRKAIRRTQPR